MTWLTNSFDRAWAFFALLPYNAKANRYVEQTATSVRGPMKAWLDVAVKGLAEEAKIFEIGSGSGRDAEYLERSGFKVTRSDAAAPFIERLRSQGHRCVKFNALSDTIPEEPTLVVANAVFCHFTIDQTTRALHRYRDSLEPGCRVAFTVKSETARQRVPMNTRLGLPRYFSYWATADVFNVLQQCGLRPIVVEETSGSRDSDRWINVVAVVNGAAEACNEGGVQSRVSA